MPPVFRDIAMIGAGNVGCTLSRYLYTRGLTVTVLIERDSMKLEQARSAVFANGFSTDLANIPSNATAIMIAVQDHKLRELAEKLASLRRNYTGVFIAHTSGIRTSEELEPLAALGATTGSFHPIQSFPSPYLDVIRLDGIGCGLEGEESFLERAKQLADILGWRPLVVSKASKTMYHLACVFAGNLLTVLAADALSILQTATSPNTTIAPLAPMIRSVLKEIEQGSPRSAFSGPVLRGDSATVEQHLIQLREHQPVMLPVYIELIRRSLGLAGLPESKRSDMLATLAKFDPHPPQ